MSRMTRDEAVEAVRRAISDQGRQPAYHREVMARHRNEWPTLWKALDALLAAPGARYEPTAEGPTPEVPNA